MKEIGINGGCMHSEKSRFVRLNPLLKELKRGPQVILPKDFGTITAYTGIGRRSKVVESGAGSGFLSVMLGNICKSVYSYENNPRFYKLAKKNIEKSGLNNIKLKFKDITKGIDEKLVDLVVLDMADSVKVIPHAYATIKEGGFLVGYLPNVEQMKDFYLNAESCGFANVFSVETIVREWLIRSFGARPATKGLMHTGFIVFAQK